MIPQEHIEKAKQVAIIDYLASKDILPVGWQGSELKYRSPLTNERTPSFTVNPVANVFKDFSSQQGGDVVRLVQQLEGLSFPSAIQRLEQFQSILNPSFSFSGSQSTSPASSSTKAQITAIRPLQHPALVKYLESRRITYVVAAPYVQEVHYQLRGQEGATPSFFGIGWLTDKGSWAIRSANCKRWIGASSISTLEVTGSAKINLFEGFFDFLSALMYYGLDQPRCTTIILNSLANLKQALPRLEKAEAVNGFLDNDPAGREATDRLRQRAIRITDQSHLYQGCNDFNEFLQSRSSPGP